MIRDLRYEGRTTAAVCELVATLPGVSIVPFAGADIRADQRLATHEIEGVTDSFIRILRPLGGMSSLTQSFLAFARKAEGSANSPP